MGLRSQLRKVLSYNDNEISKKVENLLNTSGQGDIFYLFSKEIPLFINSNWETIEKRILGYGGNLKLAVYDKPILPNFLLKNPGNLEKIEIYKLKKVPPNNSALFYGRYRIIFNEDQFILNSFSFKEINDYKHFFAKAKTELTKIKTQDCFEIENGKFK